MEWLLGVPREDQFTSAVVVGELFEGALASGSKRHLENTEREVLPRVAVLPFDVGAARVFGRVAAVLQARGHPLPDADVQVAATALHHGLALVTGDLRPFERVPGLELERALADPRGHG